MVEVECLLCEKPLKLPKDFDSEDYDGEAVCQECQSLFHIKIVKSKVRKYRIVERKFGPLPAGVMVEIFKAVAEAKRKQGLEAQEREREEK